MSWIAITGASSGIGKSLAKTLYLNQTDRRLILVGRNLVALEELAHELGGHHEIVAADLEKNSEIEKLSNKIESCTSQDGLLALVNNAGMIDLKCFDDSSDELWMRQLQINLMAPVNLTRRLKSSLLKCKGSSVVNVSSTLAQRPLRNVSAYAAAKAALEHWSRCLALEWAPEVRVNVVAPGVVDTPIHTFHRNQDERGRKIAHQMQPMKRIGRPEEIAAMIEYLIGPNAQWITGVTYNVDGGVSLQ